MLSPPKSGNAVLIKSHNNMGRCWRLKPIDNPHCQKARYRGKFNNLKNGYRRVWLYFQLSFLCTCFQHRVSFDEGHSWDKYGFTSVPLFVDGALVEAGMETHIMTWVLLLLWQEEDQRHWFYFHWGLGFFPGNPTPKWSNLWAKISSSIKWKYLFLYLQTQKATARIREARVLIEQSRFLIEFKEW